jgi:calcium-dependent protein kinase
MYKDKGPVKAGSKVTRVVLGGSSAEYVCRKLPMADMPCKNRESLARHCQLLSTLEHPHVCKFIECFDDADRRNLYLIYEKVNATTMFDHIIDRSSLTEGEAADYLRQTAMALSVAHSQGIVHGRLSPRTLILSHDEEDDEDVDTQLKVCDMGQGFVLRPSLLEAEQRLEVERYALSPEVANQELTSVVGDDSQQLVPKNAEMNDIWALGVIFYHMLAGAAPFQVMTREGLIDEVRSRPVLFHDPMWSKLSENARDIIERMLMVNPSLRLQASQLLRHPWVRVARATFPRKRMVQLLKNLQTNMDESEFKRFALRVIAEQLPTDSKTTETVEQAFRCLDKNGDGVLSVEEVVKGLKKHLAMSSKEDELMRLFEQIDRDGSGTVNVYEFTSASMDQKRSTSLNVLWDVFNAFDKDRSGAISLDEIDRQVKEIEGALLSGEQVDTLSTAIRKELEDVSSNGTEIDFDTFVYIMSNSSPNTRDAVKKDWFRFMWEKCGVDCHNVRKTDATMDLTKGGSGEKSKGSRSVYRSRRARQNTKTEPEPVSAG